MTGKKPKIGSKKSSKGLLPRLSRRTRLIGLILILAGISVAVIHISSAAAFGGVIDFAVEEGGGALSPSMGLLSAALAIGLPALAAAIAIYGATTAGAAAMAERPGLAVWVLIFAGLGEGLAIYGLVVAIMILSKI